MTGRLESENRPPNVWPPQHVATLTAIDNTEFTLSSKISRFFSRHIEHTPTVRDRTVTERHHDETSRSDKTAQTRHGPLPLGCVEMHPDGRQENSIERFAPRQYAREVGQSIIQPFDFRRHVETLAMATKLGRRLDGEDPVAQQSECRCVTTRTGSDIQDAAWRARQKVKRIPMGFGKRDALILGGERVGILCIAGCAVQSVFLHGKNLPSGFVPAQKSRPNGAAVSSRVSD
jgi:hypothetical protein